MTPRPDIGFYRGLAVAVPAGLAAWAAIIWTVLKVTS